MIDPGTYYRPADEPDDREVRSMWRTVAGTIQSRQAQAVTFHGRSFLYGLAAAVVLMFAAVGVYSTVRNLVQTAQPAAVQVDRAYEDAIGAFERVAVRYTPADTLTNGRLELVRARAEHMQNLEAAIRSLRRETGPADVSPLIRSALRDLYAKKLALLQTMIEQGDIEL